MNSFTIIASLILCLASFVVTSGVVKPLKDRESLEILKKSPTGAAVYFAGVKAGKLGPEVQRFLKDYERASKSLKDYGIDFYQVDCNQDLKAECKLHQGKVVFYSNTGMEEVNLQMLFDKDHIIGHVLFHVLGEDVAVIQDKYMWEETLANNKGKKDIVLAYIYGLGDKDHRHFMEAAFVYGKEIKFAITTEKAMPGVTGEGSMWYYQCKNATASEDCKFEVRKDKPQSVLDVIRFLKLQSIPRIVEMNTDGSTLADSMAINFPMSKVYLFHVELGIIKALAEGVSKFVDDNFYFILVDVEKHAALLKTFGIKEDSMFPNFVLQPAHLVGSEEKYYEQWPLDMELTAENMIELLDGYKDDPNTAYTQIANIVNIVHNTIVEWKKPTKGVAVIGGCMKELESCTHFKIVFRQVARSIAHSAFDVDSGITYVDFTGQEDDAKLNNLPGFEILKDGKELSYSGPMDYKSIMGFVTENLSPTIGYLPLSGSDHMPITANFVAENDGDQDELSQKLLLDMEDDFMGQVAVDLVKSKKEDESVVALTDKTFNKTRDNNDLMVTLFYLPWCVKSIIVRRRYEEAVQRIEEKRASLNISISVNKMSCFDCGDICLQEGVISYPAIKIYRKGSEPIIYTGSLDAQTIEKTVLLYQAPVVQKLVDNDGLKHFTDASVHASQLSSASVLGFFKSEEDHELTSFKKVAEEMFGKYPFAFVAGSIAEQSASAMNAKLPSFTIIKRNDPVETIVKSEDFGNMKAFVQEHVLPSFAELTAANFPRYIMLGKPFIINFTKRNITSRDSTLKALSAKTNAVFVTWMDMDDLVNHDILITYTKKADPALVLVDHKKGKVYQYLGIEDVGTLLTWSKDCLADKVKPIATLVEKEWKPLREGFDFLKMIENEKLRTKPAEVNEEDSEEDASKTEEDNMENNDEENGDDEKQDKSSSDKTKDSMNRDEL